MYSGDSAVPTMRSVRRLPLIERPDGRPGFRLVRLRKAFARPAPRSRRRRAACLRASGRAGAAHLVQARGAVRSSRSAGRARDRCCLRCRCGPSAPPCACTSATPGTARSRSLQRLGRALDARRTRRRSGPARRTRRAPRASESTADKLATKPPMPLATTSAIVSAWLHMRRRSRNSLRSSACIAFTTTVPPTARSWVVALDARDAAVAEVDHAVGHAGDGGVVRDHDRRGAELAIDARDDLEHQLAGLVVERAGGLVAQQHVAAA